MLSLLFVAAAAVGFMLLIYLCVVSSALVFFLIRSSSFVCGVHRLDLLSHSSSHYLLPLILCRVMEAGIGRGCQSITGMTSHSNNLHVFGQELNPGLSCSEDLIAVRQQH